MFIIFYECRLVSLGNLEAAVSLLLSTPPEGSNFYPNALRAVVLSSAVSQSLHELAVKVSSHKTTILQYSFEFSFSGVHNILTLITITGQTLERSACFFVLFEKNAALYSWQSNLLNFDHWSVQSYRYWPQASGIGMIDANYF